MKAYITKYALSKGIFETDDAQPSDLIDGCITVGGAFYNQSEWTNNPSDARNRAEAMKIKKIQAMRRNLIKLETMDITIRNYKELKV